jgi:hypothetical protein
MQNPALPPAKASRREASYVKTQPQTTWEIFPISITVQLARALDRTW